MSRALRICIFAVALVFGALFGVWYVGSYVRSEMFIGDQSVSGMTAEEMQRGMVVEHKPLRTVNLITIFGAAPLRVDGTYVVFGVVAFWIAVSLMAARLIAGPKKATVQQEREIVGALRQRDIDLARSMEAARSKREDEPAKPPK